MLFARSELTRALENGFKDEQNTRPKVLLLLYIGKLFNQVLVLSKIVYFYQVARV